MNIVLCACNKTTIIQIWRYLRFKSSKVVEENDGAVRKVWGDLKSIGEAMEKAITLPKIVDLTSPEVPVRQQHLSQQVLWYFLVGSHHATSHTNTHINTITSRLISSTQAAAKALAQRCTDINDAAKKLVVELSGARASTFNNVVFPTTEMAKSMQPMKPVLVGRVNVPSNSKTGSPTCVKALLNETQFAGLHRLMLPAF